MLGFKLWDENEDWIELYEVELKKHVLVLDLESFMHNLFWY